MSSQSRREIVIVGGNFGGINLSHYLLRKTFPSLKTLRPDTTFHITLISPNTHFYFKVVAPRALISPSAVAEEKYFKPIDEAFAQYDASAFEHVLGKAVGLDAENHTVLVQMNNTSTQHMIQYDSLVIATGATSSSPLWTIIDSHEKTRSALQTLHEELPKASTVLIAGAGPVGVETAGEIAAAYPNANITLTTSSFRILPKQPLNLSIKAKQALDHLGVTVRTDHPLSDPMADDKTRPVLFRDGTSESPDVFINATGARKMNTSWLPSEILTPDRRVATRDAYFRVKSTRDMYVIGDVASEANGSAIELDAMTPVVASSIAIDFTGYLPSHSSDGFLGWLSSFAKTPAPRPPRQAEYKPLDAIMIPVGPKAGVGQAYGWNVPAFMVKKAKGDKYLVELVEPLMSGKKWA